MKSTDSNDVTSNVMNNNNNTQVEKQRQQRNYLEPLSCATNHMQINMDEEMPYVHIPSPTNAQMEKAQALQHNTGRVCAARLMSDSRHTLRLAEESQALVQP